MPISPRLASLGRRERRKRGANIREFHSRRGIKFSQYHEVNNARAMRLKDAFDALNKYVHVDKLAKYSDDLDDIPYFGIDVETGIMYLEWGEYIREEYSNDKYIRISYMHSLSKQLMWTLLTQPIQRVIISADFRPSIRFHTFVLTVNDADELFSSTFNINEYISVFGPLSYVYSFCQKKSIIVDGKIYCGHNPFARRLYTIRDLVYVSFGERCFQRIDGVPTTFNRSVMFSDIKSKSLSPFLTGDISLNNFNQLTLQIFHVSYVLNNHRPFISFSVDPTNEYCLTITYINERTVSYRVVLCNSDDIVPHHVFIANETERYKAQVHPFDPNIKLTNRDGPLEIVENPPAGLYMMLFDDTHKIYYSKFKNIMTLCYKDIHGNYYVSEHYKELFRINPIYYVAYIEPDVSKTKSIKRN